MYIYFLRNGLWVLGHFSFCSCILWKALIAGLFLFFGSVVVGTCIFGIVSLNYFMQSPTWWAPTVLGFALEKGPCRPHCHTQNAAPWTLKLPSSQDMPPRKKVAVRVRLGVAKGGYHHRRSQGRDLPQLSQLGSDLCHDKLPIGEKSNSAQSQSASSAESTGLEPVEIWLRTFDVPILRGAKVCWST